jgi:hypothetical protein
MARWRAIVGIVAGIMLLLSAVAHSVLGWKSLGGALAAARVPAELLRGVKIGWQFGGACMVVFGVIAIGLFVRRLRGSADPGWPVLLIGAGYLVFGLWALAVSGFDPFFAVFIVPALLLIVASAGR